MFLQGFFVRVRRWSKVDRVVRGLTPEFWVGHLFIMVSTILGVYLAAHSGLKVAVEFDSLKTDRDNYYLRANLRDEILYNVAITESMVKSIKKLGAFRRDNYPNYQFYVMETMKEQPGTLYTPNTILSGTLQFYAKIDSLIKNNKGRVNKIGAGLRKEIDQLRMTVLDQLDSNLITLKQRLDDNGVQIYE